MVMALGTGLGLLFTVQLVTLIKKVGFKNFKRVTRGRAILLQLVLLLMAVSLFTVATHTAISTYKGEESNQIYQKQGNDATPLKKSEHDPFGE